MNNIINKIFKYFALILIFNFFANGQNAIDLNGGFVALTPNGNVDDGGWPLGEQFDGINANNSIWRTATNYVGTGGEGWVELGNANVNDRTTIYLQNGMTIDDTASYQGPIIETLTSFTGDLYIETRSNVRLQHDDNNGVVINAQNARNVFINGGTYDSTRRSNNGGEYAVNLSSVDNIIKIDNATFHGPDVNQDWVNNGGGTGLLLTSPNNVILNNITSEGGMGKQRRTGSFDDTSSNAGTWTGGQIGGGNGLTFSAASSATVFATNLIAKAGDAGNFFVTANRVDNDTIDMQSSGGSGISGTSSLNIMNGTITGEDAGEANFNSNDGDNFNVSWTANGGNGISGGINSGVLTNVVVTSGNGGYLTIELPTSGSVSYTGNGGTALTGAASGGSLSGIFLAGHGSSDFSHSAGNSVISINGGRSINNTGQQIIIQNGTYTAGHGGTNVFISSSDNSSSSSITASGGHGIVGPANIKDGIFRGGNGGQAIMYSANNATAEASGGDAAFITTANGTSFNTVIENGIFTGGNGGDITLTNGSITANGGFGLTSNLLDTDGDSLFIQSIGGVITTNIGTLIINDGVFVGGNGGRAITDNGTGTPIAAGGYGASLNGGTNIINGGTFSHGNSGLTSSTEIDAASSILKVAFFSSNSVLTSINGNTLVNGDFIASNNQSLELNNGKLIGDLRLLNLMTNVSISSAFEVSSEKSLIAGDTSDEHLINVKIENIDEGSVFKNIIISGDTKLSFSNLQFQSANNSNIDILQSNGELEFKNGAKLSSGSTLAVGLGSLSSTGNLIIEDNSQLNINFDGTSSGKIFVNSGIIDLSAPNSRINLTGSPIQPAGSSSFGIFGDNALSSLDQNKIYVDFGWLLNTSVNPQDVTSSNELVVTYSFATNQISSLGLTNTNQNNDVLSYVVSTNNFSNFNNLGATKGSEIIKFSEINEINTSDGILKDQHQLHNLISARNTEVRSRHGFASSRYEKSLPNGVSGPTTKEHSEGWLKSYNVRGDYEASSEFSSHNLDGHGTLIGLDKYFNNILIGFAAGNAKSKSYVDNVYASNTDILNGSIYSTIGGRKKYIDLAFSYGDAKTDVNDSFDVSSYKVNSSIKSCYVGYGYSLSSDKGLQLTPEISFLYSKYDQDEYTRPGITSKNIEEYSSTSKLLSTGVNIATQYQIDWFNLGLAMIPEFRIHWLHEMNNNESNTINFTSVNNDYSGTLNVRNRSENLLKVGMGLNIWSWYSKNTRLELDYDLTSSDDYKEHLISGKIGIKF